MGIMGWVLLGIFGAFVIIIIKATIASEFRSIAKMKGHNELRFFWFSFLFGIAGWFMVVALPDRKNENDRR